ncbi:MAG: hypothetical protein A2953_03380 [Candidatus Levybacteria bacterium RIFCSPLOWO2_01_FULL_36_54]|nr:MAG: hypothetical protein A2953_03380 [Candidatus Levybacteria bacterium RIFCSPLOWO2_01_FULL_36_54]OGM69196.1 MAG: hypothetical protein A3I55_00090 [Candidatus Woesebacteria bacterium RIFCSPLOWO2_02_FULL_42_10]
MIKSSVQTSYLERASPRIWHHSYFLLKTIRNNLINLVNKEELSNKNVLDLGCGYKPHRDLFQGKYVGVDHFNNKMADLNRNIEKPLRLNKKFDLVLCLDVLEHTKNTKAVINNAIIALKSGGFLFISTPFIFWVHKDPNDYYRFTRQFFTELQKRRLVIHKIQESNYLFAILPILLNYLVLALPIPYFTKYPLWFANNIIAAFLNTICLIAYKALKNDEWKNWLLSAPGEYIVIFKKI